MSKSKRGEQIPVIERVAELAMKLSQPHLANYGATTSRHDFTQRQLMSCLILRAYLKTTYRGLVEVLAISPNLRRRLGMDEKLPHYTTLQKFSARTQVLAIAQKLIATIAHRVVGPAPAQAAAMDSTGMTLNNASDYFRIRRGKQEAVRKWVKISVVVLCGSLLPTALLVNMGPSSEYRSAPALLAQAQAVTRPQRLYADAGYDAEWIHQQCREQWGVESVIKPIQRRADGRRNGKWRAQMTTEYLKAQGYGKRWAVESFFSGLKRTMGSALTARQPQQMLAEAVFRVLAYVLRR
jgi:hypothetical protein